ncbi:MAG: VOC family protein [Pseudomonadota bacterium]
MTDPVFKGVDHIHLYASDRDAAAAWYADVLNFEPVPAFARWAEHPKGPLTVADCADSVRFAILSRAEPKPFSIALTVDAASYRAWRTRLQARGVECREADHGLCASLYFKDPFGNELELTAWDVSVLTDEA